MKKITVILISVICLALCLSVFSACENTATALLVGKTSESADKELYLEEDYVYGDVETITGDISELNFYGVADNGKKFAVSANKLTAVYLYDGNTYDKKPEKFTVGKWTVRYTYQEQSCEIYFDVVKSVIGAFTAAIQNNEWTYGEELPEIEIKNPDGQIVELSTDGELLPDDTNIRQTICALGFDKSFYNSLGSEKNDIDFLSDIYVNYMQYQHKSKVVLGYGNKSSYRAGEYVLVIFDETGTYNYEKIVCSPVEFTVLDAGSVGLKTYVLTDMQAVGIEGAKVKEEFVLMAQELKTGNQGKTMIFNFDGSVTGTCDFGMGAFDELKGNDAFEYAEENVDGVVGVAVTSNSGADFFGIVSGNTLTLSTYADDNTMFVITLTVQV